MKTGKAVPQTALAKLLADKRILIGAGVGIALLIAVLVFLFSRKKKATVELDQTAALAAGASANIQALSAATTPGAEGSQPALEGNVGSSASHSGSSEASIAAAAKRPRLALPEMDSATKIMLEQIQDHVAKDPAFAAGVLRGWIEED